MSEQRTFESYRLPDGRVVPVDASASRGARFITFQLKGGTVVRASRVLPPLELIARLERTRFECEGGSLEMNVDWQELKRYVEDQQPSRAARPGEVDGYYAQEYAKAIAEGRATS